MHVRDSRHANRESVARAMREFVRSREYEEITKEWIVGKRGEKEREGRRGEETKVIGETGACLRKNAGHRSDILALNTVLLRCAFRSRAPGV